MKKLVMENYTCANWGFLAEMPRLEILHLSTGAVPNALLSSSPMIAQLNVELATPGDFQFLDAYSAHRLTHLTLRSTSDGADLTGLYRFKQLTHLSLGQFSDPLDLRQVFGELGPELKSLEVDIRMRGQPLDEQTLMKIPEGLTRLSLGSTRISSAAFLARLSDLEELCISLLGFTDTSPLQALQKLRVLDVDLFNSAQSLGEQRKSRVASDSGPEMKINLEQAVVSVF